MGRGGHHPAGQPRPGGHTHRQAAGDRQRRGSRSCRPNCASVTGIDNGYLRCGGIEFLAPDDEDVLADLWRAEGIRVERMGGRRSCTVEPGAEGVPGTDHPVTCPTVPRCETRGTCGR